jgi:hypothetical protein
LILSRLFQERGSMTSDEICYSKMKFHMQPIICMNFHGVLS